MKYNFNNTAIERLAATLNEKHVEKITSLYIAAMTSDVAHEIEAMNALDSAVQALWDEYGSTYARHCEAVAMAYYEANYSA